MPNHTRGHHYLRVRKNKDAFDYVVYFFMIATPLFEIPQAYALYSSQNSAGVSVWTWTFFMLASLVWTVYALRKRLLPLMVTSSLFFVIELTIVTGIFIYQ